MGVCRYGAFPTLLLMRYATTSGVDTSVKSAGSSGQRDSTAAASDSANFEFAEDNDVTAQLRARLDQYTDDIYSQSGGVLVRPVNLNPQGLHVYAQFVKSERRAQRAFIWHFLKLGNIRFVRGGHDDALWLARRKAPTLFKDAFAKQRDGTLVATRALDCKHRDCFHDLLRAFPPEDFPHFTVEHVADVEWQFGRLEPFLGALVNTPRYNDELDHPAADHHAAAGGAEDALRRRIAYNDPRYVHSDSVVNYRANWRQIARERLSFLSPPPEVLAREEKLLLWAATDINRHVRPENAMVLKELQRRGPDTIDLDINVDTIIKRRVAPGDIYKVIADEINAQIERAYQEAASTSPVDVSATDVLQILANYQTSVANDYRKFNDPKARHPFLEKVQLDPRMPLSKNIEVAYQRACLRRHEFHKLTEPVVLDLGRPDEPTYRVHFTDPEARYIDSELTKVSIGPKSKEWYKAMWTRLLEPIFRDVVVRELRDTRLRNIVLVYTDEPSGIESDSSTHAYVNFNGENIILHCDLLKNNHAAAAHTIRHEYEHTVEWSLKSTTVKRFIETEDYFDPDSLTKSSLKLRLLDVESAQRQLEQRYHMYILGLHSAEDAASLMQYENPAEQTIKLLGDFAVHRVILERALSHAEVLEAHMLLAFNARECGGFPSCYARTNMIEAVAEQRYAMRTEAIRIALLRHMARAGTDTDAGRRQKRFYDIARDTMKDAAPTLYAHWGTYYDNVEKPLWGLLPGHYARRERHHQIIAMDTSLATKLATEKLATHFLQRGYDVVILAHAYVRKSVSEGATTVTSKPVPICVLQSNLHDRLPGRSLRESTLHLVGGSSKSAQFFSHIIEQTFMQYTATGSRNTQRMYDNHAVKEVSVVRSPMDPTRPARSAGADAVFMDDLRNRFSQLVKHYGMLTPDRITMTLGTTDNGAFVANDDAWWPSDPNLYREKIFDGWYDVDGREVWDAVDVEENVSCRTV